MSNRLTNILIPVISVLLGIIAGTIIMLVSGYDPIAGILCIMEWDLRRSLLCRGNGPSSDTLHFSRILLLHLHLEQVCSILGWKVN